MRNVSDKRCTVNQNTHFMFKNLFPHYEGNVEKNSKVKTDHRQQYNKVKKRCAR